MLSDALSKRETLGECRLSKLGPEQPHAQGATLGGANGGLTVPLLSSWVVNPFQLFSMINFKGSTEHRFSQGCSHLHCLQHRNAVQVARVTDEQDQGCGGVGVQPKTAWHFLYRRLPMVSSGLKKKEVIAFGEPSWEWKSNLSRLGQAF